METFSLGVVLFTVIVSALVALLLRLFTSWLFALPLVLFEGVHPRNALKLSSERARGRRRTLLCWIVGWLLLIWVVRKPSGR